MSPPTALLTRDPEVTGLCAGKWRIRPHPTTWFWVAVGLRYLDLRAFPVVLYCKPESGKKWKDVNCGSGQQGKSLYSCFIYRLKPGFGRFFRGACKRFWNVLLRKDTQVCENDVLMITGLQVYKTTGDALKR
jgi:hypothetical protein